MTWPLDPAPRTSLQQGIYLERGVPPPPAWRFVTLNFDSGVSPSDASEAVERVYQTLVELQRGSWREALPATVPADTFAVLLGYGWRLFSSTDHNPALSNRERPPHLTPLPRKGFPSMPWSLQPTWRDGTAPGEADMAVQLTGLTQHAVDRAAVEIANIIDDEDLPLDVVNTFGGFLRDDGRSWIGFHDGVSNIEPSERRAAVECTGDPAWNSGGTYAAFLRIDIDLRAWRRLSRRQQELIVGRDKVTGWPIGASVLPSADQIGPPGAGDWRQRDAYFNPPDGGDPQLEASHLHRVNQNRGSAASVASHRIFRQGYEYLEDIDANGPRLGLNFVSFQNSLSYVQQILGLTSWLGGANFGGTDADAQLFMSLKAGGYYAVPPREEPFPGASLFTAT